MRNLPSLIRLMRPLNLFQGMIALLVTASLFPDFPAISLIVISLIIVWFYTGAGNALNDYLDLEIDKINRPERPLPSGKLMPEAALIFSVLLFAIGSITGIILIGKRIYVIQGVALFLLVAYSLWFKRLPLIGNIVVAAILGMAFLFGASVYGDISLGIAPAFLAFGFTLIREIIKDMEDVEGDSIVSAHTFPLVFGAVAARNLVILLTLFLSIGVLIPYFLKVYGFYYLLIVLVGVDIPLIFTIFSIWRDISPENCHRLASLLKADIFAGLLAIFAGKY